MTAHDVMDADPLAHPPAPLQRQLLFVAALVIGALVLHVGATVAISGASWAAGKVGFGDDSESDRVDVAIVDVPIEPEQEPEVEPEPEPNKPVRRTVGLNLESTVSGGEGPSFNTGNTRMGETDKTANDPDKIDRRKSPPKEEPPPPPPPKEEPNKKAQNIPTKAKVVKPKRATKVEPEYPSTLRAKGIEGTVVVRVQIDAKGKVTKVDIVAKSSHSEFDEAAKAAALRETFEPATKDGKAIPYSLSFSYRFRLND